MQALAAAFTSRTQIELKLNANTGDRAALRFMHDRNADSSAVCQESSIAGEDKGVQLILVGWSALVAGVNDANMVTTISVDALQSVFTGKVRNWRELGGADRQIHPIACQASGDDMDEEARRQIFSKPGFAYAPNVKLVADPTTMAEALAADPGAIGLSDWVSLKKQAHTRGIPLQNIVLNKQNISGGRYKFIRPLFLAVSKKTLAKNPALRRFVEFVVGSEGQTVISREGALNLAEGDALKRQYAWSDRTRVLNLDDKELSTVLVSADDNNASRGTPGTVSITAEAVFQDVDNVRKHRVEGEDPAYPPSAMDREVEGVVVAKVTIGADGIVSSVEFIQSHPAFERTVRTTVQKWKFQPFVVAGQRAAVYTVFRFVFKLS